MRIGWREPESLELDSSSPWWKKSFFRQTGWRCKYCETSFVKSADRIWKILALALFAIFYIAVSGNFEEREILLGVLGVVWLVCAFVTIIVGKYEER